MLNDYLHHLYEKNNARLSFCDFMNAALYAPGLGYYSAGAVKIGPSGDFITAPEIGNLFSRSLAHEIRMAIQFEEFKNYSILELGAGTGKMAADILAELSQHNALPEHYYILEVSGDLKDRQANTLRTLVPEHYHRVIWINTLTDFHFSGFLLANEVIDALPVHLFEWHNGHIREGQVIHEKSAWQLIYDTPITPGLSDAVHAIQTEYNVTFSAGYQSEILMSLNAWMRSLADCLDKGMMLFIDYGFLAHEYYHPSRHMGTLMCHSQHRAHSDPMCNIGLQDLTAHVNFSALERAGTHAGLCVMGFTSQANFLLKNQLLQLAKPLYSDDQIKNIKISQEIQVLTAPHEMGELFKVMAFAKNIFK